MFVSVDASKTNARWFIVMNTMPVGVDYVRIDDDDGGDGVLHKYSRITRG